jgi:hypothetical protein
MPNDCWSNITVTASGSDLNTLMSTEFKDVPEWAIGVQRRGPYGVVLRLWSPWTPNFTWLETLLVTYPSCWIKNEWQEEGGSAGVWVGRLVEGQRMIQRMEWEDMSIEEEERVFRDSMVVE